MKTMVLIQVSLLEPFLIDPVFTTVTTPPESPYPIIHVESCDILWFLHDENSGFIDEVYHLLWALGPDTRIELNAVIKMRVRVPGLFGGGPFLYEQQMTRKMYEDFTAKVFEKFPGMIIQHIMITN